MKTNFLILPLLFSSLYGSPQTITGSFTHGGQTRTYRVHLPPGFTTATSRPLVLNLHGLGSNGQQQELYTGFNTVADTADVIVAYPNALNNNQGVPEWNAYGLGSADDIGFLTTLIDTLRNRYNIDLNRVYCIGLSNGGYMSYRMACTTSCKIAAIASVAGLLIENILTPCNISRPVPLMHIHGTNDGTVAYSGVAATISSWRGKNGCPSTPVVTNLPDINTSDNSTVTVNTYTPCNNGSEVILYTVNNGGHTWPGSGIPLGPTTNQDFNASSAIWNFLRKFSLTAAYISPNPASVCAGSSRTLTASGGTDYSWSTGTTGASISVSPVSDQTYSVTINFGGACSATGSRTVTVTSGLNASIVPASPVICSGASATLSASGGTNYTWSNGQTTASISVSPASTTTYTVTVTDAGGGCSASASNTVTVNANPNIIINHPGSVCEGENAILTASGGVSYSWNTGQTTVAITVSPASSSTYGVTGTDANGCTASTSIMVTVNPSPLATITPASIAICSGSATLTASGGTSYTWNTGSTAASITVTPVSTTNYTVTVTDNNGCTASAMRTVTVTDTLTAVITVSEDSICLGETTLLTASGGLSYSWSTGETGSAIDVSPTSTTVYEVIATDGATCADSAEVTITVKPLPDAAATASPTSVIQGNSTRLTASGGDSYSWSNGLTAAIMTVFPVATTTYSVTVSLNGCTDTASVTVTVLPTGIREADIAEVKIFPNPTDDYLYIEYPSARNSPVTVEIFSVEGKMICSETIAPSPNTAFRVSLKALRAKAGVYYVKLKGEYRSVIKKSVFIE